MKSFILLVMLSLMTPVLLAQNLKFLNNNAESTHIILVGYIKCNPGTPGGNSTGTQMILPQQILWFKSSTLQLYCNVGDVLNISVSMLPTVTAPHQNQTTCTGPTIKYDPNANSIITINSSGLDDSIKCTIQI